MARRSGLGKGLGSLIPPGSVEDETAGFREVLVSSISPNPRQPRTTFDEESLASLAASVREVGVLQPLLVRAAGEGRYELIAGERRWRAAKRAGVQTVPVVVRSVDDAAGLEQALVENLQREDLHPMDEAAAYQQLIEDFHLTHDEVAARVGKSRSAVSNALRLFQLPPTIQRLVAEGRVSAGHARALLGTLDRSFQESMARRVAGEGLSVRAVEQAVRRHQEGEPARSRRTARTGPALRPPGLLELEELLSTHLDTRVTVDMTGTKGRVVIEFANLDDLERIYRVMTEPGSATVPG